jgi:anti-sigma factor RsiW
MSGDLNRADCAFVDRWLDDWLAGRLDPDVARRIDEHVAGCERCRQLKAIVAGSEADANGAPEDGAFLSAVMGQTTGSPCGRAETLLPALVDENLDADSREILQAHLAHCSGCSRLLAALQEAQRVLPTLAEIEPPLGFTQRVLGATVGAAPPPWWLRVLARPRASLELAYVGAVLLVVLLGNPVVAFTQAEQRAGQLAGAVPVARLSEQLGVRDAATGIVAQLLSLATSVANAVQTEVANRLNEARALVQAVQTAIANAIAWIADIDVSQMRGRGQAPPPRGQPAEPGVRR